MIDFCPVVWGPWTLSVSLFPQNSVLSGWFAVGQQLRFACQSSLNWNSKKKHETNRFWFKFSQCACVSRHWMSHWAWGLGWWLSLRKESDFNTVVLVLPPNSLHSLNSDEWSFINLKPKSFSCHNNHRGSRWDFWMKQKIYFVIYTEQTAELSEEYLIQTKLDIWTWRAACVSLRSSRIEWHLVMRLQIANEYPLPHHFLLAFKWPKKSCVWLVHSVLL